MSTTTRLVQFTDMHLFGDPDGRLRGIETLPSLRATVAAAMQARGDWDATLLTGDLVQDDARGYAHVRDVFCHFEHPVYCIPGNHDDPAALRRELAVPPFRVGGHAYLGDWLVVLLDSCVPGFANGALREQELQRLEALLRERRREHVLVCLHHHPVLMGSRWLDQVGLENADALFAVLDAHASVRGLLWGHVHQPYDGRRGGIQLLGTPSTCAQFKPNVDGFAIDPRPPAYRWLDLGPDGTIHSAVEWVRYAPASLHARAG
jgi:Icc protein